MKVLNIIGAIVLSPLRLTHLVITLVTPKRVKQSSIDWKGFKLV